MVAVKFNTQFGLYNGGEVAGFPADTAAEYVRNGIAEFVQASAGPSAADLDALAEEQAVAEATGRKKGRR